MQRPGALSLVIGNGCCDSTAPFLFEAYMAGPGEAEPHPQLGLAEHDVDGHGERVTLAP